MAQPPHAHSNRRQAPGPRLGNGTPATAAARGHLGAVHADQRDAAAVARTAGAATIIATDVSDYRLGLATQVGVDHVLNANTDGPDAIAAAILDITGGEGVDASLEMSGHPTALHHAFRSVKNGGRVTLFGIPSGPVTCDLANEVIFKGIRVHGITGRRIFSTWYRLAGLFKAGLNIRPVLTHTFPLKDFAQGFELIKSGQCGKVVLFP